MNKKELLNAINKKVVEVQNLVAEDKIEEAKAAREELDALQEKFNIIKDLEGEPIQEPQIIVDMNDKPKVNVAKAFINIVKAKLTGSQATDEDVSAYKNSMNEGTPEDGGLTVPEDVSTTIRELRRSEDALENLVTVENVSNVKGSRVYEVNADQVPFDNVDEEAEFPELATPKLKKVIYAIKKKGGIIKLTRELLSDSAENILAFLNNWIAKKTKATRNALILKQIKAITAGKEVAVSSLDDLKKIFNVQLDPAIAVGSICLTNQDGFNWLDTLKDSDGKYIVQPDPTKATVGLLFGKYPITVVSNKTMATETGKTPIVCGDLKAAITLFDLENLTIETSTEAGDLWAKDMTGVKVRERLDCQTIDDEAVVMAQVTLGE